MENPQDSHSITSGNLNQNQLRELNINKKSFTIALLQPIYNNWLHSSSFEFMVWKMLL